MKKIVEQRCASVSEQQQDRSSKVRFWDTMHNNKPPTFDNVYQVVKSSKEKDQTTILRADRNVLQRLIIAYEAGCKVDLHSVLQYELMPVPMALAEMNGSLRTGQKSILADILTSGINCPIEIQLHGNLCLLIDGLALVAAIGRRSGAQTFGDFADSFQAAVLRAGSRYQQIHVIFDRYQIDSIKSGTRKRRTKSTRPIRRVIEDGSVPLPHSWPNFLALPDNKSDLARFLSEHIIVNAPPDKVIVAAVGFEDEKEIQSSERVIDLSALKATHEEADARLILYCVNSSLDNIVVSARETDVLLLLVRHIRHDVWHSHKAKVFQHQGDLRKSSSWFCIRSSAISCLNGLRHNILDMQTFKEISLKIIFTAPHTSFFKRRGRANRGKDKRNWKICL